MPPIELFSFSKKKKKKKMRDSKNFASLCTIAFSISVKKKVKNSIDCVFLSCHVRVSA